MTLADLRNFAQLQPGFVALTAGAFGACVGSFLNVCKIGRASCRERV